MKIYTEINYKWLDGQLVKTDDKSFEYEGEVTLCEGDGGGVVTDIIKKVSSTASDVGEAVVEPVADVVQEVVAPVAETVQDVVEPVAEVLQPPPIKPPPIAPPPIAPPPVVLPPPPTITPPTITPPTITPPTITPPTITPPTITPPTVDVGLGELADLPSQIEETLTDPLGAATTGLGIFSANLGELGTQVGENVGQLTELGGLTDAVATGTQNALQNLQITNLSNTVNDAMNQVGQNVGLGGDTLNALGSVGETLDDIMEPINETIWDAMGGINTSIADGLDTITGPFRPKGGGTKVDLKKMKSRKGKLKNKSRGQLRLNKSKGRARQSLRIG